MRIFSPTTEYNVLTRLYDGDRRFVARSGNGNTCLLVVIDDEGSAKRYLPQLLDWSENKAFTEFIEFFPYESGVVAAFAYHMDGFSISSALNGADYRHRAFILRSLLALLLIQNVPGELLSEALKPENLQVSHSGKVSLLYDLPNGGNATLADAVRLIAGNNHIAEAIASKTEGSLENYIELYEAVSGDLAELEEYSPPPESEKTTALVRLRESVGKIKKTLLLLPERLAFVAAATVVLAAYALSGLLFYNTVINPPKTDNGIMQIGTVTVSGEIQ